MAVMFCVGMRKVFKLLNLKLRRYRMSKKRRVLTLNNLTLSLLLLFMVGLTGWLLFEGKTPQLNPVNAAVSGEEDQAKTVKEESGASLSKLRIPFVRNEGQVDKAVKYYAQTFGGTVFVTETGELVYSLPKFEKADKQGSSGKIEGVVLKEQLTGGSVKSITAQEKSETQVSYFRGSDPKNWKSGISTFSKVNLGEVYEGVDVSLKAYGNNVEKLFYVKPGANPDAINIGITGAKDLKVNEEGQLVLATKLGDVTFSKPIAYQEIDGKRVNVEASYEIKGTEEGNLQYAFNVAEYDRTKELVIDPVLQSTFLGGGGDDTGYGIAINPKSGDVYVTGQTFSSDFPKIIGGADPDFDTGGSEVFVSRLSSSLQNLIQSTYLGGTAADDGRGIAINPTSGEVYVTGQTFSSDFPVTSEGADAIFGPAGSSEAFVSRLSSTLQNLIQSTYLGGSAATTKETGYGIAINPNGDVYVTGRTDSSDFPDISTGADSIFGPAGSSEAFVSWLSSSLQ